ncbi:MAG: hypothetical protein WD601_02520, partial [Pseudohongiellaceae bacterium]
MRRLPSGFTFTSISMIAIGVLLVACGGSGESSSTSYTVTALAQEGGSISPQRLTVANGETATFTITPDSGFGINSVAGCGGALSGDQYTTEAVTANCSVETGFSAINPAELNARAYPGSVTLSWDDSDAERFNLYSSTAPGCDLANYTFCDDGTLMVDVTSPHTITELDNGQNYWFRLESEAGGGRIVSNETGARPDKIVPNTSVRSIAQGSNGITYLGGSFSMLGPVTGNGVPISLTTGKPGAFPLVDGSVRVAVPDGAGGYYIGGNFEKIDGESRSRLAHIRSNGTLGNWNPEADDTVEALAVSDNKIYVGGDFTAINGQSRNSLAAITTDEMLTDWNPDANEEVFSIAISQNTVYIGGDFTEVDGQMRRRLAAIGTDGTVTAWSPEA